MQNNGFWGRLISATSMGKGVAWYGCWGYRGTYKLLLQVPARGRGWYSDEKGCCDVCFSGVMQIFACSISASFVPAHLQLPLHLLLGSSSEVNQHINDHSQKRSRCLYNTDIPTCTLLLCHSSPFLKLCSLFDLPARCNICQNQYHPQILSGSPSHLHYMSIPRDRYSFRSCSSPRDTSLQLHTIPRSSQ